MSDRCRVCGELKIADGNLKCYACGAWLDPRDAEIARLRGLIVALPCFEAERVDYTCRDVRFHDGKGVDSKFWCAVCRAKEAANG